MDLSTVLSLAISLFSTIAAILAWIAKLRWSNEFVAAKDEIIKAKEAQISSLENEVRFLREITSPKIHEYYTSVKTELEEFIDIKDSQLAEAKRELKQREEQLSHLQKEWESQKANIEWELNSGINITLEGWVQSVDLRERETEGHTQRVTNMTVALAKAMGLSDEQIIHIRRGAMLHDIGKMGVPENILLKPGALTDDEFAILKQHPTYAQVLLSSVEYLRPAIDIPYCHHEKWDGTGYPRGLKGDEIPLAARVFSIIDVWDSLRADRPYRAGYTMEQAVSYIREQSGKYFDPMIVDVFINKVVYGDKKLVTK